MISNSFCMETSNIFLFCFSYQYYNAVQIVSDISRVAKIWIFLTSSCNGNRNANFTFLATFVFIRATIIIRCVT